MAKLKAILRERNPRITDAFNDFDKLRRGTCRAHQVNTAFTVLRIELEPKEMDVLLRAYDNGKGLFRYRDFIADMSEVPMNCGSQLGQPLSRTQTPGLSDTMSSATSRRAGLCLDKEATLEELEVQIRKHVQRRSLPLKSVFKDFDKTRTGTVTRQQFLRIMAMLSIHMTDKEAQLVCEVYCDPNKMFEFRYLDFCAAVDIRLDALTTTYSHSGPSKYFTRKNQVLPHPLKPIQVMSARPVTR